MKRGHLKGERSEKGGVNHKRNLYVVIRELGLVERGSSY